MEFSPALAGLSGWKPRRRKCRGFVGLTTCSPAAARLTFQQLPVFSQALKGLAGLAESRRRFNQQLNDLEYDSREIVDRCLVPAEGADRTVEGIDDLVGRALPMAPDHVQHAFDPEKLVLG